ncbi:MAG: bifunctional diaminohydroxyphosphoribosylaminopyrimidine deaminase/5-amino-6-(5-phosphoribosylamino)uracil reductase RibD [Acidimicrobiia bacterium]|nr:bifunctional diaminohydroxyphosphoribosylaminopyrimidine deaminase/5-amino-6-(5-phosphoribosylamino)uracil reductase RibD [Acidimicrobiia bacterium]
MSEQPMERAIRLARGFRPHPNPRVGAVVVDPAGRVVGEGAHELPGLPHAEVIALAGAGSLAAGSTMYVTLEPCNHTGRTGPCVSVIVNANVEKVVVGTLDPDQQVSGEGIAALRAAGIEVEVDGSSPGLKDLDPGYFHHRTTGRPRFTLKSALTLDGQVAAHDGTAQWITGEEARLDGHRLRAESDAVLVGAGTVFADDPRLDVRLPGYSGPQPRPVVLTGRRTLPEAAQVLSRNALVVGTGETEQPGDLLIVPSDANGRPDIVRVAAALGEAGLVDVMIEGGPAVAGSLWRAGLVDRGVWYIASRIAGGSGRTVLAGRFETLADARTVEIIEVRKVGADLRVEFVMEG